MKRSGTLGCLGIVLIVSAICVCQAGVESYHVSKIRNGSDAAGMVLIEEQSNYIDLSRPWTLIVKLPHRIAFLDTLNTYSWGSTIVVSPMTWISEINSEDEVTETFVSIVDCESKKRALFPDSVLQDFSKNWIPEWESAKFHSDSIQIKFVCERNWKPLPGVAP